MQPQFFGSLPAEGFFAPDQSTKGVIPDVAKVEAREKLLEAARRREIDVVRNRHFKSVIFEIPSALD